MKETAPKKKLPEFVPGMRVEILTPVNRLIFVGKIQLVGEDGEMIQVQQESGQPVPYVEYNSVVKVRGFAKEQPFTLQGKIGGSSQTFWRIDRLCSLQDREQREFFRQNIVLEAKVMRVTEIFDQQEPKKQEEKRHRDAPPYLDCSVLDISAGGVRLRCKEKFKMDDYLFLADVKLDPEAVGFSFTCKVKRVQADRSVYEYGCQFCDLEARERERLIRSLMLLQRKELQERRAQHNRR